MTGCPKPRQRIVGRGQIAGRRRPRTDRGAAATELALLAPVVMLVIALLVGGARIWLARAAVTDAAQSASRAATLERNGAAARQSGEAAARAGLENVPCDATTVAIDTSGFSVPVGQPARVTATIGCAVPLSDLFGLGLPGTLTVQAGGMSALDTYRRRE
ncbi:MAG: TadE/TadG family type IV pilus assembly protein [Propionibacteriaceae bacterium]|nr:TadE/TadG family type IV pilus assembly protein [Propionibacteriaceae bacterium]